MNPDPGDYLNSSKIAKFTLLTLVFSLTYFYNPRNAKPLFLPMAARADTIKTLLLKEKSATKKKRKTIYLTFDDGPNKGTQNVLNIINNEKISATLFVIGEHVYGSRLQNALYDSILASSYIEIANHSYSHAYENRFAKFYAMPDSVINDFKRCADSLELTSNIIRTPGRNIWRLKNISHTDINSSSAAADSLYKRGYKLIGWDLEWHYNNNLEAIETTDELVKKLDSMFIHNQTKTIDHLVLLAHDQVYKNTTDSGSLHRFVSTLKEKTEYDFALVNQYPGIHNTNDPDSVVNKK